LLLGILLAGLSPSTWAAEKADEADNAWKTLEKALRPPVTPDSWRTNRPSEEEILNFRNEQGKLAAEASAKAREFYTKFPDHGKATEAKLKEYELATISVRLGNTNLNSRLEELEAARVNDPNLSEDERFELLAQAVQRRASAKRVDGMPAVLAEFEKGARDLQKRRPTATRPAAGSSRRNSPVAPPPRRSRRTQRPCSKNWKLSESPSLCASRLWMAGRLT
jgi:hypothetical protein